MDKQGFVVHIGNVDEEYLNKMMSDGWKYQVHYVDYADNEWTVPVYLSPCRISYILLDNSIDKLKLSHV